MNVRDALSLIRSQYTSTAGAPEITHPQAVLLAAALADGAPLHPKTSSADAAVLLRAETHLEQGTPIRQALAQARTEHAPSAPSAPTAPQHHRSPNNPHQSTNTSSTKSPTPETEQRRASSTTHDPTGNLIGTCLRCSAGVGDHDLLFGVWDGAKWRYTGYTLPGSHQIPPHAPLLCTDCGVRAKHGLIAAPVPHLMEAGAREGRHAEPRGVTRD